MLSGRVLEDWYWPLQVSCFACSFAGSFTSGKSSCDSDRLPSNSLFIPLKNECNDFHRSAAARFFHGGGRLCLIFLAGLSALPAVAVDAEITARREGPGTDPIMSVRALIQRVLPAEAGAFDCELIAAADGKDVYEYE